jgi:ribosomal protein S18 acetylase RimI-like enzyme
MNFRTGQPDDVKKLIDLHKAVARQGGGIARLEDEITEEYVEGFIKKSLAGGLIIVAIHPDDPDRLVAEIHGYKAGIKIFDHVLGEVTVLVDPEFQGKKVGKTLMMIFLDEIVRNRPDIGKVELFTGESNQRALALYQALGFRIEGRLEMRARTPSKDYEADVPLGWQNPNFEFEF